MKRNRATTTKPNHRALLLCDEGDRASQDRWFADPNKKFGLDYAQHLGLEIVATCKVHIKDEATVGWEDFLKRIESGSETHILVPGLGVIPSPGHKEWVRLTELAQRLGKVLHFFQTGNVFHKDSSVLDICGLKPGWLGQVIRAENKKLIAPTAGHR